MSFDIAGLCRLCLRNTGRYGVQIPIFGSSHEDLATKITSCLPVTLDITDNLPKHICKPCFHKVEDIYNYNITCASSESYLKEKLSEYQVCDVEIEVCTDEKGRAILIGKNLSAEDLLAAFSQVCQQQQNNDDSDDQTRQMEVDVGPIPNPSVSGMLPQSDNTYTHKVPALVSAPGIEIEKSDNSGSSNQLTKPSATNPDNVANNESTEQPLFMCASCTKNFNCHEQLVRHFDQHHIGDYHDGTTARCQIRTTSCKDVSDSCSVKELHSQENKNLYHCSKCDTKLTSSRLEQLAIKNVMFQEIQNSCTFNINGDLLKSGELLDKQVPETHIKIYNCECGEMFYKLDVLESHVLQCQVIDKRCVCDLCGDNFLTQYQLDLHTQKHFEDLKCTYCAYRSNNILLLENHKRHCYKKNWPFECSICNERFLLCPDLELHKEEKHRAQVTSFSCNCGLCGEHFNGLREYELHKSVNCILIPESTGAHQQSIVSESFYVCDTCQKIFVSKSMLEYHMIVHLAERDQLTVNIKQMAS